MSLNTDGFYFLLDLDFLLKADGVGLTIERLAELEKQATLAGIPGIISRVKELYENENL